MKLILIDFWNKEAKIQTLSHMNFIKHNFDIQRKQKNITQNKRMETVQFWAVGEIINSNFLLHPTPFKIHVLILKMGVWMFDP